MLAPSVWFVLLAAVTAGAWAAGWWSARHSAVGARLAVMVGLIWLGFWVALHYRPDVAVMTMPSWLLSRLEGTASVPAFMLIVGVAMSAAALPRQRAMARCSAVVGAAVFVYGGVWMIQPAPTLGGSSNVPGRAMQSTEYTCVAAASATALDLIGVPASELEMVELTGTRRGQGATFIRAYDGLRRKLEGTTFQPRIVRADLDDLGQLPMPALTALTTRPTSRHMVVITRVTDQFVWVFDPATGDRQMLHDEFDREYARDVILFVRSTP
ncbi:MAG: cysteine peptidase family C39 domain-containing protein [Planctomycetota bacterium]